jgi:hypothetical protein
MLSQPLAAIRRGEQNLPNLCLLLVVPAGSRRAYDGMFCAAYSARLDGLGLAPVYSASLIVRRCSRGSHRRRARSTFAVPGSLARGSLVKAGGENPRMTGSAAHCRLHAARAEGFELTNESPARVKRGDNFTSTC